jgi:uncharacterized protein YegP (UPF0339 family)
LKNSIGLILLALLCNSCATIFNGKNTKVNIYAPEKTKVSYQSENYNIENGSVTIYPKRSKDSLQFTLIKDSISNDFSFRRKISGKVFLNLMTPSFGIIGVFVDLTNQKRFTYKRNIYFEIDSANQSLFTPYLKPILLKKNDFFIYTTPLKAIDVFSQPMLTIGAEYFFTNKVSFSAEYGTVFSDRLGNDNTDFEIIKEKGRSFRYELKYYNLLSISSGPRVNEYIGLESRFMRYHFNDVIRYRRSIDAIDFNVNEIIAVGESVNVFNIKYGLNYPIGDCFYLDLYSGFGIRIRTVKNPGSRFNPETDFLNDDGGSFFDFRRSNSEVINDSQELNFTLGFKFGVKF